MTTGQLTTRFKPTIARETGKLQLAPLYDKYAGKAAELARSPRVYPAGVPEEQDQRSVSPGTERPAAAPLSDHINENIEGVVALQRRERDSTSASQRRFERVSRVVARPAYLMGILVFSVAWMVFNLSCPRFGITPFDPPPFQWLEMLVSFVALFTTTVVLIAQNRQARFEQQRAHLDLQVNLLTEQKVAKVIHLLEELRRDLPMVKDRHDPQATVMQERADTAQLASALDEVGLTNNPEERRPPGGEG